ncbi:MAG TPA: DUF3631 domain-containing protein [Egibacteraceae bacterium]
MTPAQAGFWRRLRRVVPQLPDTFTPGTYRCPAHDDRRASMQVGYQDGRILLTCHAGCQTADVLRRLGLPWSALFEDVRPRGRHVATYPYTDDAGNELYRVLRFDPKSFAYQHRNADGVWEWGRGRAPWVLYRLPRVLDAVRTGERVWIVEGEKDVEALERAGAVATTTAGGAGKRWRPEYTEALRGAYVTIVADRDDAGRRKAREVYHALRGVAAEVTLVETPVNRPHADVSDHLDAGFGLDDLVPLDPGPTSETTPAVTLPQVARDDGAAILAEVEATYRQFVVFADPYAPVALALWTAHTHALDAADTTPYVHVHAPERESGKTRVGEVAACLVCRAWQVVETTEAALYRKLADAPTLILDEVQGLFVETRNGDEYRRGLRAVLQAGYRRGGAVPRCEQRADGITVVDYPTFGAKMLIGTGHLPDMLASRAIPIRLHRKTRGERVERFSVIRTPAALRPLHDRLAAWAKLVTAELREATPPLPEALSDRQQDIWEPLLAIADLAGGAWPERARTAAVELHGRDPAADPSIGVLLLAHIAEAFEDAGAPRLATEDLLRRLADREDGPWGEWWGQDLAKGQPKAPAIRLARLLKPYGIAPKQFKWQGEKVRGYEHADFTEAWARYLPPSPAADGTDGTDGTPQVSRGGTGDAPGTGTDFEPVPAATAAEGTTADGAQCCGATTTARDMTGVRCADCPNGHYQPAPAPAASAARGTVPTPGTNTENGTPVPRRPAGTPTGNPDDQDTPVDQQRTEVPSPPPAEGGGGAMTATPRPRLTTRHPGDPLASTLAAHPNGAGSIAGQHRSAPTPAPQPRGAYSAEEASPQVNATASPVDGIRATTPARSGCCEGGPLQPRCQLCPRSPTYHRRIRP